MNLRLNDSSGLISNLSNPNTRMNYIIIIGILLFMILVFVVFRKKRKVKIFILIATLLLIPFGVRAICTCEIEIESHIFVSKYPKNVFFINNKITGETKQYHYDDGMTWGDWLESEYNVDGITIPDTIVCEVGNNVIHDQWGGPVLYRDRISYAHEYKYEVITMCTR